MPHIIRMCGININKRDNIMSLIEAQIIFIKRKLALYDQACKLSFSLLTLDNVIRLQKDLKRLQAKLHNA